MIGLLIYVLRKSKIVPRHEIRIITMGEGLNSWEFVTNEALSFKHGGKTIEPDALYRVRPGLATRIRWKLAGISGGFITVFKKGETKAIKYEKPNRTAETLLTVKESRALGQALKDEFRQALGGRTIFIVIFVVVVGVLVYYFYTGRIG